MIEYDFFPTSYAFSIPEPWRGDWKCISSWKKKYFQPQTMGDSFHHMFQHHFYLYISFQLYCVIIRYNIAVVPGRSAPAFEPTISKWRMINKRRFDETMWSIYRMGFYHFKIDVLPCSTEKVMKQIVNGKYYPQNYMNINLLCF